MRRAFRILVGYRDDIALNQRWWHRVFQVVGILAFVIFGFIIGDAESKKQPVRPRVADVEVLDTLEGFVASRYASKEKDALDPGKFVMFDTFIGLRDNNYISNEVNEYDLILGKCWAVKEEIKEGTYGPTQIACPGLKNINQIVRYRLNCSGLFKAWIRGGATALGIMSMVALVALNLYYRGLVYIICGPRKINA
jgi:hypothetical protein